jgi:hypothetical protein
MKISKIYVKKIRLFMISGYFLFYTWKNPNGRILLPKKINVIERNKDHLWIPEYNIGCK